MKNYKYISKNVGAFKFCKTIWQLRPIQAVSKPASEQVNFLFLTAPPPGQLPSLTPIFAHIVLNSLSQSSVYLYTFSFFLEDFPLFFCRYINVFRELVGLDVKIVSR